MNNFEITSLHVNKAIAKLKNSVSNTPDNIPSIYIKQTSSSLSEPLTRLFNQSLKLGKLPILWKQARVTPIPKNKGTKSDPANLRPISLTSAPCRLLESINHEFLVTHLLENNIISSAQYGFLKNRSTLSQHLTLLDKITNNYENNIISHVIYLDFAKAFDSVCHSKLINVLHQLQISNTLLSWITNYLSDRTQQTVVDGWLSDPCSIMSGVPQGSVLGPLLFILYLEDLIKLLQHYSGVHIFAFADDLKLLSSDPTQLQQALNIVERWSTTWQINLQLKKCEHITFCHKNQQSNNHQFFINNTPIPQKNNVRDLGIILNNNLKWDPYINSIYSNSINLVYVIIKSFKSRNFKFYVNQYNLFIRPKLEYNVNIWTPALKGDIKKVESIQATFTRLLCKKLNFKYNNYPHRCEILKLETLEIRRIKYDLITFYKILNNLIHLDFNNFFKFNTNIARYNLRRHELTIANPKLSKTSVRRNFYSVRIVNVWNSLPQQIVTSPSLEIFKHRLNKFNLHSIYTSKL